MNLIECSDRLPNKDGDYFCIDKKLGKKKVLGYSKEGGANSLLKITPNRIQWLDDEMYNKLEKAFEELLVEQFAISELRDLWRKKAGIERKCED
jgi:hypothetical protein